MPINSNNLEVNLTPQFRKDLKTLAKRYRSIRKDLQPLIEELQSGNTPGDRLQGIDRQVFKVRLKSDATPRRRKAQGNAHQDIVTFKKEKARDIE